MNTICAPRIVVAGTNSGVGKTTIVAGLLAALRKQGICVQSFKVGPDYIDPGFHTIASGRPSYNLDTWLVPKERLVPFFTAMVKDVEFSIIEGVMGLYDGGREGISSTATIAKALSAPVILVIDCKAMGESAAAIAKGFRDYDPDVPFGGVILNRLGSANHEQMIRHGMEKIGVPVIGAIYRNDAMKSPERHLGLTPVTEIDPTETIETIRQVVTDMVDMEALVQLGNTAPALPLENDVDSNHKEKVARIGVAYDEAFSFYYPASLHALEEAGAELVYFSPLQDYHIPNVDGLVFGGGFPEMFLPQLEKNTDMRESICQAADRGMPIYAECGGLMYLCQSISDFDGKEYAMVGVVPATCHMQHELQRVGYVTATAKADSILLPKDHTVRGHEFHFSTMEPTVDDFPWAFALEGGRKVQHYIGGYNNGHVLASYLHLNFAGTPEGARRLVEQCATFRRNQ